MTDDQWIYIIEYAREQKKYASLQRGKVNETPISKNISFDAIHIYIHKMYHASEKECCTGIREII